MSRRRLSDEERVLWQGVTRSIVPLRRAARADAAEPAAAPRDAKRPQNKRPQTSQHKPGPIRTVAPAVRPPPPALAPLDRRLRKRVARGAQPIEGRLDLHGMTQAEAHHALTGFLRSAQARGAGIVLVITGKGDLHGDRGVLRRQVPMWLRHPELRGMIVGFESAGIGHGGEGALYVRLRRARND
jgi:DNA-nicking Smr family endonuclease